MNRWVTSIAQTFSWPSCGLWPSVYGLCRPINAGERQEYTGFGVHLLVVGGEGNGQLILDCAEEAEN